MSISRWMDKQNMVCPCNEIWFSHNKDWSTDACSNMDGPQKHDAKWEKPDTKDHILYDSIYMQYPEQANL